MKKNEKPTPCSCGCLVYEELLVNRKRFPLDCKERIWYKMHPPANSFDWCPSELRLPWKSCCFKFEFVRRLEHLGQLQVYNPLCQNVHLAAPLPQPSLPSWIHQSPGGNACIKLCGAGCLRGVFSQCVSIQAQTSLQKKCRWQQRQGSENPPDMLHLTYLQSCWKQAIAAIGSKSFVDL